MENKNGHWQAPWDFDPEEWVGFVYRICDVDTGKEYIGKKFFFSTNRKKVKGRKNRKVVRKQSDWKSYTGSSKELNAEIERRGKDSFKFFIESLHESRSSLAYREVEAQIKENVLREKLVNGDRKFYNGMIAPIKFKVPDMTNKERLYQTRQY